jgi:hypothetical protein
MKPKLLSDKEIVTTCNAVDFSAMVTADDYIFVIARAIIAARDAQWTAMLAAPHEAKTEAEKTAYAFGWFKALESVREKI